MAVLVEAISVIVRMQSIESKFAGGWLNFVTKVPNATLCADNDLARVGFMQPDDVKEFINQCEEWGLCFLSDGQCQDIAVVDQIRGPTMPCNWLEYAQLPFGNSDGKIAVCWLFEGQRIEAHGIHMPRKSLDIATPEGWDYEKSLSAKFTFIPNE